MERKSEVLCVNAYGRLLPWKRDDAGRILAKDVERPQSDHLPQCIDVLICHLHLESRRKHEVVDACFPYFVGANTLSELEQDAFKCFPLFAFIEGDTKPVSVESS